MERCIRCDKTEESVALVEGIYGGEVVKICELCANMEGVPTIRKPTADQIKAGEKSKTVYERLKNSPGYKPPVREEFDSSKEYNLMKVSTSGKTIDSLRRNLAKDNVKTSASQLGLIDNFHWAIMTARRKRGLTPRQLGEKIGETELTIRMIERSEMPDNASSVVPKIESYLGVRLQTKTPIGMNYARSPVMVGDANVGINPNMMTVGDMKSLQGSDEKKEEVKKKGMFGKMVNFFLGEDEETEKKDGDMEKKSDEDRK